jgi:hypothetical protein
VGFFGFAEIGFVDFDDPARTTKRAEMTAAHCLSDAMRHEPRGFQGDAQGSVKLIAADALLAGRKQRNRL